MGQEFNLIPYHQFTGPLFSIGSFHVQPWGFMVAIGFLAGLWIIVNEAKRRKLDAESVYGIALAMMIGGVVGGRLLWIFTEAPSGLGFFGYLNFWNGGMAWFGGMILGLLFMYCFMKWKKLNVWKYLDAFAVGLPLGMAIGRIGCYLIGDHLGKGTVMPWAILLYGQLTHPVILYEIILLLLIFGVILYAKGKKLKDGGLFSLYVMAYSFGRFIIDFARVDATYFGLTIAQYVSIAMFIAFGIILLKGKVYKG